MMHILLVSFSVVSFEKLLFLESILRRLLPVSPPAPKDTSRRAGIPAVPLNRLSSDVSASWWVRNRGRGAPRSGNVSAALSACPPTVRRDISPVRRGAPNEKSPGLLCGDLGVQLIEAIDQRKHIRADCHLDRASCPGFASRRGGICRSGADTAPSTASCAGKRRTSVATATEAMSIAPGAAFLLRAANSVGKPDARTAKRTRGARATRDGNARATSEDGLGFLKRIKKT